MGSFVTWLMNRRGGGHFSPPTWECVQEPGDLLYVPEGFFHATACVFHALGVTHLADRPSETSAFGLYRKAESYLEQELSQSSIRSALSTAKLAITLDPTNAVLWMLVADVYGGSGNVQKAVKALRKALKLNPLLIDAHHALLFGLQEMGEFEKARHHRANMVRLGIDVGSAAGGSGTIEVDLGNIPSGRAVQM